MEARHKSYFFGLRRQHELRWYFRQHKESEQDHTLPCLDYTRRNLNATAIGAAT